jgi:hypothetical protein
MENNCDERILLQNIQKFIISDDPLIQKLGKDIQKKRAKELIQKQKLIDILKEKRNSIIRRDSVEKKNSVAKKFKNKLFRKTSSQLKQTNSEIKQTNSEIETDMNIKNQLNVLENAPNTENVLNHSLISNSRPIIFSFYENNYITDVISEVVLRILKDQDFMFNDKFSLFYNFKMVIFDFLLCIFDKVDNSNIYNKGKNRTNVQNIEHDQNVQYIRNSKNRENTNIAECLQLKCNKTEKMLLPIANFLSKEKIDINYINKYIFLYINYSIYFALYYGTNQSDQYIEFNINPKLYKNACKYKSQIKSLEKVKTNENTDKILLILIQLILNFLVIKTRTKEDRLYDLCKFIPYNCQNKETYDVYLNQWKEKNEDTQNNLKFNKQYISSLVKINNTALEDATNHKNYIVRNMNTRNTITRNMNTRNTITRNTNAQNMTAQNMTAQNNLVVGAGILSTATDYAKYGINKATRGFASGLTKMDMFVFNGSGLAYILKKVLIGNGPPNPLFTDIFLILIRKQNLQFIVEFIKFLLQNQNTNTNTNSKIIVENILNRYIKKENFFDLLIKLNIFIMEGYDVNINSNSISARNALISIIVDIVNCYLDIDKEKKKFLISINTAKKSLSQKLTVRASIDKITNKVENMKKKYDVFVETI